MNFFLTFILLSGIVIAQINVSGKFNPSSLYRLKDGTHISLPFRMAEIKLGLSSGNFEFNLNSSLEYRWRGAEKSAEIREAYFTWYPDWGEIKIGKQIHAWGAADGNNPTDNLNADDYYYLFLTGADRKIGSLSAAAKIYRDEWQAEIIFLPDAKNHRLPFGEKDFPLKVPDKAPPLLAPKVPFEYGLRVQTSIRESDIGISYFKGHDRGFSLVGFNGNTLTGNFSPGPNFGFRNTSVFGSDLVAFWKELTFRLEAAYFITENRFRGFIVDLPMQAEYVQYVFQVEYPAPADIILLGQIIGSKVLKVEGNEIDPVSLQTFAALENNFQAQMGTPFAIFSELAFFASSSAKLMDDRLELKANAMLNLDEKGSMLGAGFSYSPQLNWSLEISLIIFDGGGDPDNVFTLLEDFSQINLSSSYNF